MTKLRYEDEKCLICFVFNSKKGFCSLSLFDELQCGGIAKFDSVLVELL